MPEASPHTTSCGWGSQKCVGAHVSPGKGRSGGTQRLRTRGSQQTSGTAQGFQAGDRWVRGCPGTWGQDEVVRETIGYPSNSGGAETLESEICEY